ncbi:MAG TPA: NUDIX hydrolase [Ktedonobacteraceae bacterium]|jgi:8-oxo-dGTP pyrophosphatase MutT (NUDIX family)
MNGTSSLPLTHAEAAGSKPAHIVRAAARLALVVRRTDAPVCLFVRHPVKGLELPGGAIEPGETPLQASLRELAEETGFQLLPHHRVTLAALHPVRDARGGNWLDLIYTVVTMPGSIALCQEAELPSCWLTLTEIHQQLNPQSSSSAAALAVLQSVEQSPG